MTKFKVGNRVKISNFGEGRSDSGYQGAIGDIGEIYSVDTEFSLDKPLYTVIFKNDKGWKKCRDVQPPDGYTGWNFYGESLEMAKPKPETYTLIVNGDTTVLKDDDGNVGVSKRDPKDEYNLGTGVDYAMKRLKGELPKFNRHHETKGKEIGDTTKTKQKSWEQRVNKAIEEIDRVGSIDNLQSDTEPDWSEVPMGTPVLVRDDDNERWRKGKFVCKTVTRDYPYRALLLEMTYPDVYAQIKLDKE